MAANIQTAAACNAQANPSLWEAVDCPLCGASGSKFVLGDGARRLQRCIVCGFLYVLPRPSPAELKALYSNEYFTGDDLTPGTLQFRAPVFEQCLGALAKLAPRRGRLLDVGCWTGEFLEAARAAGWTASGIELSTRAARFANTEKELDVRCCTLLEAPWPAGSFDVLTMLDVLEHVIEPLAELSRARTLLKPNGIIVVRVPNAAFHLATTRVCRLLHVPDVGLQMDYHLNHFTPRTLAQALLSTGFEVISLAPGAPEVIAHAAWAPAWAKRAYVNLARAVHRLARAHIENIMVAWARRRG